MENSLGLFIEEHFLLLYSIHIVISIILAIVVSAYISSRFITDTTRAKQQDSSRLQSISNRSSRIFRFLFNFSLHKNNRITSLAFIFLFNLAMPIVGYFFSFWIAWYLKNVTYNKKVLNTNILNLDEFSTSFLKVDRIFGEGSMSTLLVDKYSPKSKKLKALSALASNLSPANLKIIRQTLSSTDDEIRMFGYAVINKAEQALNVKINRQLEIFTDKFNKKEEIAAAAKELASLYWEMVYTELSHESLKDNFLKEVVKYVKVAKDFYITEVNVMDEKVNDYEYQLSILKEEDEKEREEIIKKLDLDKKRLTEYMDVCTKLYVMMGRVYLSNGKYDKANTEFTIAQELDTAEASFILPYLAEVHYLTGNFNVVHSMMNMASNLNYNSTLYSVSEQWKVS
jgi:tetratricopeptide (TPR) repeat protein